MQGWVYLSIDSYGFNVHVKEVGKVVVEGVKRKENEVAHEKGADET